MEQLCFQGEVEECKWIRSELLSWNKSSYWFYVIRDEIWVANEWGGRLAEEKLVEVKKKCLDLSRTWRDAR